MKQIIHDSRFQARFFWWLVVLLILIPAGLVGYALLATHTSDPPGATLTAVAISLGLGAFIDAALWLAALTLWIARTRRRDSAAKDSPVVNPL